MNVRALDEGDLARVADYLSHPQLIGLTGLDGDRGLTLSVDEITQGIEKWRGNEHEFIRAIEVRDELIGHVRCGWWWDAMAPRVEIIVRPVDRRQGLGAAAGRWALRHLFMNTPAHVIHASTPDWNEGGIRFAERLGFERAGSLRRTGIRNGTYVDSVEFELLRTRWEALDADRR